MTDPNNSRQPLAGPATNEQLSHLARQRHIQAARQDDLLPCQWTGCTEACPTAEQLYDHVCERHVGRKSTNNLNLVCGWGTCRTATVKRDHITSHIRVHVPLKPHRCHFCGKSFKRPQDLKKHVKTHADNADDLNQPEPSHAQRERDPGFRVENGKAVITDLQALAATATGYYDGSGQQGGMPHQGYGGQTSNGNPSYYGGQPSSYGGVYYNMNSAPTHTTTSNDRGGSSAYDSRRRGYEALNEFFGDAKRHHIDPSSSRDVGQRLLALQGLQLPEHNTMSDYQTGPAMVATQAGGGGGGGGGGHGPLVQHQYSLPPMQNLRTKTDLTDVDRFLEQMQSTVYESSNQAAAAGVAQPGAVFVNPNVSAARSPAHLPSAHYGSSHQTETQYTTAPLSAPTMATASSHGTPALTPPSSSLSHTSAHSPTSLPTSSIGSYPSLPAVSSSAADEMLDAYATPISAAPAATLGSVFDHNQPRRYSGGMLQQAGARTAPDAMDTSDATVAAKTPTHKRKENRDVSSALIDPALSGLSSPSRRSSSDGESESAADRIQETWIENIRVVEALRKLVADRLQNHDYEDDGGKDDIESDRDGLRSVDAHDSGAERERERKRAEMEKASQSLYPVLRAIETSG